MEEKDKPATEEKSVPEKKKKKKPKKIGKKQDPNDLETPEPGIEKIADKLFGDKVHPPASFNF